MHHRTLLGLILTFSAACLFCQTQASAQRPLEKLQKRWRENMPKGELLKKLRENIEENQKNREEKARQKALEKAREEAAKRNKGRQPTPADPRDRNANDRRSSRDRFDPADARKRSENNRRRNDAGSDEAPDRFLPPTVNDREDPFDGLDPKAEISQYKNYGFVIPADPKNKILKNAELKKGDRIIGVGGTPVESMSEVEDILSVLQPGDRISMVIARKGKKQLVMVSNGKLPVDRLAAPTQPRTTQPRTTQPRTTQPRNIQPRTTERPRPPAQKETLPKPKRPILPNGDLNLDIDDQEKSVLVPSRKNSKDSTDKKDENLESKVKRQNEEIRRLQKQMEEMRRRMEKSGGNGGLEN